MMRQASPAARCRFAVPLVLLLVFSWHPLLTPLAQSQEMMQPRVPPDRLAEARALTSPLPDSPDTVEQRQGAV